MNLEQFKAVCAADREARASDPAMLFDGDPCVVENGTARRATFADFGASTVEEAFTAPWPDHVLIWWGGKALPRDFEFEVGAKD